MKKPVILIPMGDPAGVGPEIIIKALADPGTANSAVCVVIGDKGVLEGAMQYPNMPKVPLNLIQDPNDASPEPGVLNLIDLHNIDPAWFRVGQVDGRCGKAAYAYIETAIRFANERHGDAVATPPINKVALSQGGVPFIGHTEIFGKLTGGWKAYMYGGNLERLLNVSIDAGQAGAVVTLDWYYIRDNKQDKVFEDTTPTSSFTGSFDGGMLDATGSGRVTIAAFWEKDGHQYATGSFIWPSGETSTIALVRP